MLECKDYFGTNGMLELSRKKYATGEEVVTYASGIFTPWTTRVNEIIEIVYYGNKVAMDIDCPFVKGGVFTQSNFEIEKVRQPTIMDNIRVWFKLLFEV
jgi:hypothetical protein